MTGRRSTRDVDCPQRLCVGDVVEVSVKQRYCQFTVLEVVNTHELTQSVTASAPGLGAVRFEWIGGHHRIGRGHGMTFYYVPRGNKNV